MAVCIHELCHLLSLWLLGIPVSQLTFTLTGAKMQTGPMAPAQECLSAAAGPLGGLLPMLFCRYIPRIAICGLVQSLYNLLPLFPLDGGRILRCCLWAILSETQAARIEQILRWIVLIGLSAGAIWLHITYAFGLMPLLFVGILGLKTRKTTFPCKEPCNGLQ